MDGRLASVAAEVLPPSLVVAAEPAPTEAFLADLRSHIDFAFQPIVNIHSGTVYGFEALLRDYDKVGFSSIREVFDYAFRRRILHRADLILREVALAKFARLTQGGSPRLFFNLDNRILDSHDYSPGRTLSILSRHGLSPIHLCFELTEDQRLDHNANTMRTLGNYRAQSYRLAIDDFGAGYSGLKLLYECQPDFIKIDRFFISNIQRDHKKKLFVSNIVNLAHILGVMVIAEGIEGERELQTCKEIGCDLVQGNFVERPLTDIRRLKLRYDAVGELARAERRERPSDRKIICEQIEAIPPLPANAEMSAVFETFRRNTHLSFFPVVDEHYQPLGLVLEKDFKEYTYSLYGRDLITNKAYGKTLKNFLSRCPTADIHTEAEKILETYSLNTTSEGIIIVDNHRYVGFLSAASLLRVINEKNLAVAREQNPLTKLPGNTLISQYVTNALADDAWQGILIYMDFDNFKPFNDTYGFRQGDRAILLFADLLRKHFAGANTFVGHVGGDDFFAGIRDETIETARQRATALAAAFRNDVESFYDEEARTRGGILARDRHGETRLIPLLTTSVAILSVPAQCRTDSVDDLIYLISCLKKEAKAAPDKLCTASVV